jgi:hypothetical protein
MPPREDPLEDAAAESSLWWCGKAIEALAGEDLLACAEEARLLPRRHVGEDEETTIMVSNANTQLLRKAYTKAMGMVITASTMKSHLHNAISGIGSAIPYILQLTSSQRGHVYCSDWCKRPLA